MIAALARVPLARLGRTPRAWLPVLAWTALALVTAVTKRSAANGADQTMRGVFAFAVVPLVAYAVVAATLGGKGLGPSIRGVVALGASPRRAALATTLVAAVASAAVCAILALAVCALAHGASDPPLARDLLASTWISALGGAAYASFFCAGSAIGKGAARAVFLVIDAILGAGGGVSALLVPRGHVQSLLGGALAAEISQRASSVMLAAQLVIFGALTLALTRRR